MFCHKEPIYLLSRNNTGAQESSDLQEASLSLHLLHCLFRYLPQGCFPHKIKRRLEKVESNAQPNGCFHDSKVNIWSKNWCSSPKVVSVKSKFRWALWQNFTLGWKETVKGKLAFTFQTDQIHDILRRLQCTKGRDFNLGSKTGSNPLKRPVRKLLSDSDSFRAWSESSGRECEQKGEQECRRFWQGTAASQLVPESFYRAAKKRKVERTHKNASETLRFTRRVKTDGTKATITWWNPSEARLDSVIQWSRTHRRVHYHYPPPGSGSRAAFSSVSVPAGVRKFAFLCELVLLCLRTTRATKLSKTQQHGHLKVLCGCDLNKPGNITRNRVGMAVDLDPKHKLPRAPGSTRCLPVRRGRTVYVSIMLTRHSNPSLPP